MRRSARKASEVFLERAHPRQACPSCSYWRWSRHLAHDAVGSLAEQERQARRPARTAGTSCACAPGDRGCAGQPTPAHSSFDEGLAEQLGHPAGQPASNLGVAPVRPCRCSLAISSTRRGWTPGPVPQICSTADTRVMTGPLMPSQSSQSNVTPVFQ